MPHRKLARRRGPDPARALAYRVLREVSEGAYANLALGQALADARLDARDAAFVTELVAGTCRLAGTYDRVLAAASGRDVARLQPSAGQRHWEWADPLVAEHLPGEPAALLDGGEVLPVGHHPAGALHQRLLTSGVLGGLVLNHLVPQVNQDVGEGDLDRAHVVARAAQR